MKFYTAIFPPYTGSRSYTYQSEQEAKPGQYAVVKTPTNGFQVVKVLAEVDKPDFACRDFLAIHSFDTGKPATKGVARL